MSGWLRAWAPALVWAAVLFSVSSRPTLPADLSGGLDKVAHFGAFALLGLLLAHGGLSRGLAIGWPILFGLVYAASDEIHQAFVPGRYPDAADWVADALGVVAGCFFLYRFRRARRTPRGVTERAAADSVYR